MKETPLLCNTVLICAQEEHHYHEEGLQYYEVVPIEKDKAFNSKGNTIFVGYDSIDNVPSFAMRINEMMNEQKATRNEIEVLELERVALAEKVTNLTKEKNELLKIVQEYKEQENVSSCENSKISNYFRAAKFLEEE